MDRVGKNMYDLGRIIFAMKTARAADPGLPPAPAQGFARILMAGRLRGSTGLSVANMRVLGHYAVVFLAGGGGMLHLRGRAPVRCRRGDLLVVFPEIAHAYGPGPGERWDEYYLVFDGAVFDLWRSHGLLSPERPVLRLAAPQQAEAEIRALVRAAAVPALLGRGGLELAARLQQFLAHALTGAKQPGTGCPGWAVRAMQVLADPRADPREAARAAGLSYESFRKKFRAVSGMSPAAWRDRQAMQLARKWIYEERLGNKELAERLGYCDEFHFSRRFRQIIGRTPRAVRRAFFGSTAP